MIFIEPSILCLLLIVVAVAAFLLGAFTVLSRVRRSIEALPCEGAPEFLPSARRATFLPGPRLTFSREFRNPSRN
jgi:hypothetical protein